MITVENYGDVENVTIAQFGNGTMRVTSGKAKDNSHKGIFMGDSDVKHEIGEHLPYAPTTNEFKPKIAILFDNKESFDVFFDYVMVVKEEFEKEDTTH